MTPDQTLEGLLADIERAPEEFDRYLVAADRLEELGQGPLGRTYRWMGRRSQRPAHIPRKIRLPWCWFRQRHYQIISHEAREATASPWANLHQTIFFVRVPNERPIRSRNKVTFRTFREAVEWLHRRLEVLRGLVSEECP